MADNREIKCPNCGSVLGHSVIIKDTEWLQMGGGIAREWHGVCAQCGKEVHWSVSDRLLESLIRRVVGSEAEVGKSG